MTGRAFQKAEAMAGDLMADSSGIVGFGVATVCDAAGKVVQEVPFANLVTTAGDKFYAQAIAAAAGGAAASPGAPTGMKLGTAQTAAHKSTADAANISAASYLTNSNNTFDVTTVASAVAGTDTGWQVKYECYWGDGDVTSATIWEVALVNDAANNAYSTAANTYARVKLPSVIDKSGAGYTLRISWYNKFLGA